MLFDLDGTLLPLDAELFEKVYFSELGKVFADEMPPGDLIALIWSSTRAMIGNIDFRTNEEVFMEDLGQKIGDKLALYQERFNHFYRTTFDLVRHSVREIPVIKDSVAVLREKGYRLVVATNPIFPEEAIHKRIRWAGFEPRDFDYISTFEKNHYCKPQLNYYREVLQDIQKAPDECLMVGNDVQEDLIAGQLGMKTYLINEHLLHRNDEEIAADYVGNYEDFHRFVLDLPGVE